MTTPEKKIPVFFLDEEAKSLLRRTRDLLDRILDTFEILEDSSLMKAIADGELDYQDGRIVSLGEYLAGRRSED